MPPLYDNIADALLLTQDGSTHTVSLDNQGATFENNEATAGEPQECVWAKIDLSAYPDGEDVLVSVDLVRTGGGAAFAPEFAVFKVIDATFDPTNPDFTKVTVASYLGSSSTDPPPDSVTLKGGVGSSTGNRSQSGIFYLGFNDWNYAVYGTGDAVYSIPVAPVCLDAVDIINPDSPTATIVSGRVREDWQGYWDYNATGHTLPEKTFKFTWAADAGLYRVKITGQLSASGGGGVSAIALVNGRPFYGPSGSNFTGTTPNNFFPYNGFDNGTADVYDPSDYGLNPWLVLSPGDLVEILILSAANTPSFDFNPFETSTICFIKDSFVSTVFCTGAVNFDNAPLGDDWGDEDGWGGQRLIPDQIYAIPANQPGPDDPHTVGADFPWGVNFTEFDGVALPDGTVYFMIVDGTSQDFPGGSWPSQYRYWLVLKKYDPGSGTWSQVATLNVNDPEDRYPVDAPTCEVGPDGMVYCFWWEVDTYTDATPDKYLWKWHMVRLDPSDDSVTELGTGQNAAGVTNQNTNHDMIGQAGTTRGASIAFSGDDVYVGLEEIPDLAWTVFDSRRIHAYVWRWDGSSWTDLNLPDPTAIDTEGWEVEGENQYWDVTVNVVAADRDGPKSDGVTCVYAYNYFDDSDAFNHFPTVTITYTVGSGWGTELLSDFETIVNDADRWNGSYLTWSGWPIDTNLMWSAKLGKLVMATDIQGTADQVWDLFQLGETDWEIVNPLGPGASAGTWWQSRNSAAIGPDGDVWRGIMSEPNFYPAVIKHSPGYSFGFANGAKRPIGAISGWEDPQGRVWDGLYVSMFATTNYRIRWVGNSCYIFANLFNEPHLVNDTLFVDWSGQWPYGEGFFVIKGTYVPCTQFRPHFYRRVLG